MALRFRTRLSLTISFLIFLTVTILTSVVAVILFREMYLQSYHTGSVLNQLATRNIAYGVTLSDKVTKVVEDQMAVQAFLVAELVALGDTDTAAGVERMETALKRVLDRSMEMSGEALLSAIRVSDSTGRNEIEVQSDDSTTLSVGEDREILRRLLRPDGPEVVRGQTQPDAQDRVYEFVGVSGVDEARIVAVDADRELIESLTDGFRVQDFLERSMISSEFIRMAVVDSSGELVAAVKAEDEPGPVSVDEETLQRCAQFLNDPELDADIWQVGPDIGVVTPLTVGTDGEAYALFVLHRSASTLRYLVGRVLLVIGVGVGLILVGFLVSYVLSRGLSKPIVELSKGAHEFGRGNFNYRLYLRRKDEFYDLAQAFNTMAISLQEYMHELRQETSRRERLESELRIASDMQRALLPQASPKLKGVEMAGLSQPSREVGGDFYDFIRMGPERIAIVVGDAAGKGLPAALLITECWSILRTLAQETHEPGELLRRTNTEFYERIGKTHRFVTLFILVIDVAARTAKYASAGHPPALLTDGSGGGPVWMSGVSSFPLGIEHEVSYPETELELHGGETVLIFSDGLTDAQDHDHARFGEDRIRSSVAEVEDRPIQEVLDAVRKNVLDHTRGREAIDDMTIVGVRIKKMEGEG